MGLPKLMAVWVVVSVTCATASIEPRPQQSPLTPEAKQLHSRIAALEHNILDITNELKSKDDRIAALERIIKDKLASISSLEKEIEVLQKRDHEEEVTHARARELENQVEKLTSEIESQSRKRDALEYLASQAEWKALDLNRKLESLQKTVEKQNHKIQKTQQSLKAAEEDLVRKQLYAASKSEEFTEVHEAWFSPWLVTHLDRFLDFVRICWHEDVKPNMDLFIQKAAGIFAEAPKWAKSHLELAVNNWIPAARVKLETFTTSSDPYMQSLSKKATKFYEMVKSITIPHAPRVQKMLDVYIKEVKKIFEPYVHKISVTNKPHAKRVLKNLGPLDRVYKKLVKSLTGYHRQVRLTVHQKLQKHELTKPLASMEISWFLASALIGLPAFFVLRLFATILRFKVYLDNNGVMLLRPHCR